MTYREECTEFLQWALPRLEMRWVGFRRVRSQVCKRISRRIDELGLVGFAAYRRYLEEHDGEWRNLDRLCRITISRFYRDREIFDRLRSEVIPELARAADEAGRTELAAWSCGCASGEEPYTLAMAWQFEIGPRAPELRLRMIATDSDPAMLERARRAVYRVSSLRDLPDPWRRRGCTPDGDDVRVVDSIREAVRWRCQDVRRRHPEGPFDLVLCRNLVFTYYVADLQRRVLGDLLTVIRPGGVLVVGSHESLPDGSGQLEPWGDLRSVFRRAQSQ
jgi:chemotaxis protein methyltransferase CheR